MSNEASPLFVPVAIKSLRLRNRVVSAPCLVGRRLKCASTTESELVVGKQLDLNARLVSSPVELEGILGPVAEAGVDVFHCSTRRYWESVFEGSDLSLAAWTRKLTGCPVIAVGSVTLSTEFKSLMGKVRADVIPEEVGRLEESLRSGQFDLIAIGRALIANPDWVHKVKAGRVQGLRNFTRSMLDSLE